MWRAALRTGRRRYARALPAGAARYRGRSAWAEEWLATCFELQTERAPDPDQRIEIHLAVQRLIDRPSHRSMTDFGLACQDIEVRKALSFYTLDGPAGWLHAFDRSRVRHWLDAMTANFQPIASWLP